MQSARFACLPDDDAADAKVLKQQEKEAKKNAKNKPKEMPKAQKEDKDLQNLAFGGSSKKKNKKKNNKQTTPSKDDFSNFEEWKEREGGRGGQLHYGDAGGHPSVRSGLRAEEGGGGRLAAAAEHRPGEPGGDGQPRQGGQEESGQAAEETQHYDPGAVQ